MLGRIRGIRAFTKHSLWCWPWPHHPIAQFQCYGRILSERLTCPVDWTLDTTYKYRWKMLDILILIAFSDIFFVIYAWGQTISGSLHYAQNIIRHFRTSNKCRWHLNLGASIFLELRVKFRLHFGSGRSWPSKYLRPGPSAQQSLFLPHPSDLVSETLT